jgi:hypothetical protein
MFGLSVKTNKKKLFLARGAGIFFLPGIFGAAGGQLGELAGFWHAIGVIVGLVEVGLVLSPRLAEDFFFASFFLKIFLHGVRTGKEREKN